MGSGHRQFCRPSSPSRRLTLRPSPNFGYSSRLARRVCHGDLDGLLYHDTGPAIEEHYTDTGGVTDHVFGLCHLFGFRFAPRIRDIKERKLYLLPDQKAPASLAPLVGGVIDTEHITAQWDQLLRLATSIRTGTTTSSAMLKKLSAYPRQNGLAKALREVGRIERTLFT